MRGETVLLAVVTLVVAIDSALILLILRRLHLDKDEHQPELLPRGWRIDPSKDSIPWGSELEQVLSGEWLLVLALFGCSGCATVRRELDASEGKPRIRVAVIVEDVPEISDDLDAYLESWTNVDLRLRSPDRFAFMSSIGNQTTLPVLIHASEGRVIQTANYLRQLQED